METREITKQIKKDLKKLSPTTKFSVRMCYPQVGIGYTDGPKEEQVKNIVQKNITDKMSLRITRWMSSKCQTFLRKEFGFENDDVYNCEKTNGVNNSKIVQNKFDSINY